MPSANGAGTPPVPAALTDVLPVFRSRVMLRTACARGQPASPSVSAKICARRRKRGESTPWFDNRNFPSVQNYVPVLNSTGLLVSVSIRRLKLVNNQQVWQTQTDTRPPREHRKTIGMRPGCVYTAVISLAVLLGSSDPSGAFLLRPGSSPSTSRTSTFSSGLAQKRSRNQQQQHQQRQNVHHGLDWRHRSGRNHLRNVLFLEP